MTKHVVISPRKSNSPRGIESARPNHLGIDFNGVQGNLIPQGELKVVPQSAGNPASSASKEI